MPKNIYSIPYSINVSRLDSTVSIASKDGSMSLRRPIKLKTLALVVILGLVVPMYAIFQTKIGGGGVLSITLMLLSWETFIGLMIWPQDNGLDGWKWFVPTIAYWVGYKDRMITTRGDAPVAPVEDVLNIVSVDKKTGIIKFTNGWFGRMYYVDGYASNLMFDNEQTIVLSAYERYLQKIPPNMGFNIVTQMKPVDLKTQIANADQRYARQRHSDLRAYAKRRHDVLSKHIVRNFKMAVQCQILIADSEQSLYDNMERFETAAASNMARSVEVVEYDDIIDTLASIYQP